MNSRSGFLFFELMIALAIITGFALMAAYHQMGILGCTQCNIMRLKALDKCNAIIEQSIISSQLPFESTIIDEGITITWSAKPYNYGIFFEKQFLHTQDCTFFEIAGSWQSNDGKKHQVKINTILQGLV